MVTAAPASRITADRARAFASAVLIRVGLSAEDATIVADAIAWADLRGISAQGLAKLPRIVARFRAGGMATRPRIALASDRASFAVLEGNNAWGHVAGVRAMRLAIAKARETGIGAVTVRNTNSGSAMGYYPTLAVGQGFIGLAINNGTPLMPPHGGTTRVLGNQAFAIGSPADRHAPILFDTATSAITWTRIHELHERGEPVPAGVALTAEGVPTVDHQAAVDGILLPMAEHRGFGLALMWELLTGVLSGSERFARDITPLARLAQPQSVSLFMLALDPAAAMPREAFLARVDSLIDQVHASPPATGIGRILVPGERAAEVQAERERDGIPLSAERLQELERLGAELGYAWHR